MSVIEALDCRIEQLEDKLKSTELELRKEKKRSELRLKQRNEALGAVTENINCTENQNALNWKESIEEADKEIEAEVAKVV